MFYDFNAHKKRVAENRSDPKERSARRLAGSILWLQRRWATYLARRSRRLPKRILIAILFGAGLTASAYCLNLVLKCGQNGRAGLDELFNIETLKSLTGTSRAKKPVLRYERFEDYLDSLEKKIVVDSLQNLSNP